MEEFIELIKEKTEAEYAKAEAMAKLSEFPLDKLKDSPFEEVANAIKRRAQNEADIMYDFVEDIWTDIYEPTNEYFKTMKTIYQTTVEDVFDQIRAFEQVEKTMKKKQSQY